MRDSAKILCIYHGYERRHLTPCQILNFPDDFFLLPYHPAILDDPQYGEYGQKSKKPKRGDLRKHAKRLFLKPRPAIYLIICEICGNNHHHQRKDQQKNPKASPAPVFMQNTIGVIQTADSAPIHVRIHSGLLGKGFKQRGQPFAITILKLVPIIGSGLKKPIFPHDSTSFSKKATTTPKHSRQAG